MIVVTVHQLYTVGMQREVCEVLLVYGYILPVSTLLLSAQYEMKIYL